MLITLYLTREILRPFALVCGVLMLLMLSYSALTLLADAESELVPNNLLMVLIFSRSLSSFELFLPLALYVTLLMGLGKLYSEHEIIAMHASGIGIFGIIKSLLPLILIVTILTSLVSLVIRPWSYDLRYQAKHEAEQIYDFDRLEKGYFYANEDNGKVYFVKDVEQRGEVKRGLFIYEPKEDYSQVIYADTTTKEQPDPGTKPILYFEDGSLFRSAHDDKNDLMLDYDYLTVISKDDLIEEREFKVKAASNAYLSQSQRPDEVAEYQWRLISAFKAFFLILIAVLLAKTSPRQGNYGKLIFGILVFFIVHAVSLVAETWIEQGSIPPYPGLWLIVLALIFITSVLAKRYS